MVTANQEIFSILWAGKAIAVFTRVRYWTLSGSKWILSIWSQSIYWRSTL